MEAFAFFEKRIKQLGPDVSALCAGLRKLRIVAFQLKEGEDNPHRIFETMNTCGRDLTCADMIGNFILMPLDRECQSAFNIDPQSASKFDPPEWRGGGCPGSQ